MLSFSPSCVQGASPRYAFRFVPVCRFEVRGKMLGRWRRRLASWLMKVLVATLVMAAPGCLALKGEGCLPALHLAHLFRSARKLLRGHGEEKQAPVADARLKETSVHSIAQRFKHSLNTYQVALLAPFEHARARAHALCPIFRGRP